MRISDDKKQEILDKATLINVLNAFHSLKKKGSQEVTLCPLCQSDDKLQYSKAKEVSKCFKCGIAAKSPVDYLMNFQGMTYPEALEELARIESIDLTEINPAPTAVKAKLKKRKPMGASKDLSFCERTLIDSGLSVEDVTSLVKSDEETEIELSSYVEGTVDDSFQTKPGDDMIIRYYDLNNKPMYYYRRSANGKISQKRQEFFRVRYQNPALHKDRFGNATKYRSPYGSDSKVYLPAALRTKYKNGSHIKTLYVQEGEKKADKATKHGMISVGIMGIHNLAYQKALPYEFELIIKRCNVEQVVFVLDEDWNHLGRKIDAKRAADLRPKNFFSAVKNFRDYFYAFTNNDIHLHIFFGYVRKNNEEDKGVDDLLSNTLKGKESDFSSDCEAALVDPKGETKYMKFHKITTVSEFKLMEYWGIQNTDAFVAKHKETLKKYPEFKIGKLKWRFNEAGVVELAQPLLDNEQFWVDNNVDKGDKTIQKKPNFNHNRFYTFLKNRGYGLYNIAKSDPIIISIEGNVVDEVSPLVIRHFTLNFTKQLNNEQVLNMLYSNAKNYFGKDCLFNMEYKAPKFHENAKGIQYLYFEDKYWAITAEGIEEESIKSLPGQVWTQDIKKATVKKTSPLLTDVKQLTAADCSSNEDLKEYIGEWVFEIPEDMLDKKEYHKCDILQFIMNTSQFNHNNRTRLVQDYDSDEYFEYTRHVMSKLTALGYLFHNYRDSGVLKAVIAMDGKMSEVGDSNGRSGKSLLGIYLEQMMNVVTVAGKKRDLMEDRFIWEEVDERTRAVFIDDIMSNFNLELLFPHITGKFSVEKKGMAKTTLGQDNTPKFYITTNHALKGEGGSFRDRQQLIGFSDWYNEKHKPSDEFGYLFFDDYDQEKWNYCYNLTALCLQLYFKHGLVEAPKGKLERRQLRQNIGEDLIDWADEFFSKADNLNTHIPKSNLYQKGDMVRGKSFLEKFPKQERFTSVRAFKKKLINYTKFKGWEFNPKEKGGTDKRNGVEYVTISVPESQYNLIKNTQEESENDHFMDTYPNP